MATNRSHSDHSSPVQASPKQSSASNFYASPLKENGSEQNCKKEKASVAKADAENIDPNCGDSVNATGLKRMVYRSPEITDRDIQLANAGGNTDDFYKPFALPEEAHISKFGDSVSYCFDTLETGYSVATSTASRYDLTFFNHDYFQEIFHPIMQKSSLPPAGFGCTSKLDLSQVSFRTIDSIMKSLESTRKSEPSMGQQPAVIAGPVDGSSVQPVTSEEIQGLSYMDSHIAEQYQQYSSDQVLDHNHSSESSAMHSNPGPSTPVSTLANKFENYCSLKDQAISINNLQNPTPNVPFPQHKPMPFVRNPIANALFPQHNPMPFVRNPTSNVLFPQHMPMPLVATLPFSDGYNNASIGNYSSCYGYENKGLDMNACFQHGHGHVYRNAAPIFVYASHRAQIPYGASPTHSNSYSAGASHSHMTQIIPLQFLRPQMPFNPSPNSMFPRAQPVHHVMQNRMSLSYIRNFPEMQSRVSPSYQPRYATYPDAKSEEVEIKRARINKNKQSRPDSLSNLNKTFRGTGDDDESDSSASNFSHDAAQTC